MPLMPHPYRLPTARPVPGQRTFYRLAILVIVVLALSWAHVILLPLALAILLAFALTPPAEWFERRGLGRVPSALVVAATTLSLIGGVGTIAGWQAEALAADIKRNGYERNIANKLRPVIDLVQRLEHLQDAVVPEPRPKPPGGLSEPSDHPTSVQVIAQSSSVLSWLPSVGRSLGEILINVLLVTVLSVFLLVQREKTRDRLIGLTGRHQLATTTRALEDAARRVSHFLLLQAGTNAVMGLLVTVGLYLIGIPYAALWGLLTACLRFLPYVGIWISALFPFVLALATFESNIPAVLVLAVYAGLDLVMTNVVEPLLFGRGTGVSSLALLLAAVFWAFLWGPVGLLLAVPMTTCLVVLGEHVPSLRFLRTLLGDAPAVEPAALFLHRALARDFDGAAVLIGGLAADRPLAEVYDTVLLPAVAQAKTERERQALDPGEERRVYRATADVLRGALADRRSADPVGEARSKPGPVVVACSTRGRADRLALLMLRDLAAPAGCEVRVVATARFVAEVKAAARGDEPVACIAAVSPGGLAQVAGLCKKLKTKAKKVRVVVGRWGMTGDTAEADRYLRAAGADDVAWTLRQTLDLIAPAPPTEPGPHQAGQEVETPGGRVVV
jgi:predicted PurR-regulated permease PerM